ncbi:hypothetical protein HYALB_00009149 [Hymenoscyphus albidus]|uniref:Cytochrome P450 n=1 Tax=Hymenoscyphus albidus TaxID=595503 RepID=A0A9N9LRR3_9HELO|nr:hypothetical protein HYALB_00009149 [Hymenoscyphus albidus]
MADNLLSLLMGILTTHWIGLALASTIIYVSSRCVYHLYFHPVSQLPGPKLAAVSNVWYAYHWITGKYPMAVEKALEQYGDVVRIAPNEIVFIDPRAASGTKTLRRRNLILHYLTKDADIYGSHTKHLEHFTKTNFIKIGQGDQGIAWETDPVKHRNMVKKISPAFNMKSVRAKDPTMHKHIDHFVQIVKEVGSSDGGVELREWTNWLALHISAELAFSRHMHQLNQRKSSPFLEVLWGMNFFLKIHQVCRKFPLLSPIQFLFAPPSAVMSELKGRKITTMEVKNRIKRQGKTVHLDHFDQTLGDMDPDSTPSKREQEHLEVLAVQMIVAGYEPISSQVLCTIMFSLLAPETYKRLVDEIRMEFTRYEGITPEALAPLEYLNASLMETFAYDRYRRNRSAPYQPGCTCLCTIQPFRIHT